MWHGGTGRPAQRGLPESQPLQLAQGRNVSGAIGDPQVEEGAGSGNALRSDGSRAHVEEKGHDGTRTGETLFWGL